MQNPRHNRHSFLSPAGILFWPTNNGGYTAVAGGIEFEIHKADKSWGLTAYKAGKAIHGYPVIAWGSTRTSRVELADFLLSQYADPETIDEVV